jgi:spore germination protein GerM
MTDVELFFIADKYMQKIKKNQNNMDDSLLVSYISDAIQESLEHVQLKQQQMLTATQTQAIMIYFISRDYRVSYYNKRGELKFAKVKAISRKTAYKFFKMVYPEFEPIKVVLY